MSAVIHHRPRKSVATLNKPIVTPLSERILLDYISNAVHNGSVDNNVADSSRIIWKAVRKTMSVPNAGAGPDGEFILTWDRDNHHLEAEIMLDGHIEWFYYDRSTERTIEEDTNDPLVVPERIQPVLTLFR